MSANFQKESAFSKLIFMILYVLYTVGYIFNLRGSKKKTKKGLVAKLFLLWHKMISF